MLSGHVEGQLLKMLVGATARPTRARDRHVHRVLGAGHGRGAARRRRARRLRARPRRRRVRPRRVSPRAPAGDRIEVRVGPAAQTLTELAADGEPFDLVFIDADKAGYVDYVDTVLSAGLLARDGLLCVDNTLMQGQPWTGSATTNGEAIAAVQRQASCGRARRAGAAPAPRRADAGALGPAGGRGMNETVLAARSGVDLGAAPLTEFTDADVERLRVLLALYGVVVARDQVDLDDTAFEQFLRRFGRLRLHRRRDAAGRSPRPQPRQQRRADDARRAASSTSTPATSPARRPTRRCARSRSRGRAGTPCSATSTALRPPCPRTFARASRDAPHPRRHRR